MCVRASVCVCVCVIVCACAKKASEVCNIILANVNNFENNVFVHLYKKFARPYLDYKSVIYSS